MSRKLTFITGGARSGKSSYALTLADARQAVLFVATAQPFDDDMRQRISRHQAERPATWRTLEAPLISAHAATLAGFAGELVIVDCLTLLANNVLFAAGDEVPAEQLEAALRHEIDALLAAHLSSEADTIVVSNEVGLGIVPANRLARLYRDMLGRANQQVAAAADEVIFMVSGLPLTVK